MAAPVVECPLCRERGDEITRALAYAHRVEAENRSLVHLREEVTGLRKLRPAIAVLELQIACLLEERSTPIESRDE